MVSCSLIVLPTSSFISLNKLNLFILYSVSDNSNICILYICFCSLLILSHGGLFPCALCNLCCELRFLGNLSLFRISSSMNDLCLFLHVAWDAAASPLFSPKFLLGFFSATCSIAQAMVHWAQQIVFPLPFFIPPRAKEAKTGKTSYNPHLWAGVILVYPLKGFSLTWGLQSDYTQAWVPDLVCCHWHVWEPLKSRSTQGECWHQHSLFPLH